MATFTIGIPTYNRAHILHRSIDAALTQTYPDVEVVICDNASTDGTEAVVRAYGDRVRYHCNETNIGSWPNFARLTEHASGKYFSWLQDDDLIHSDFARRAVAGLSADDRNSAYFANHLWTTRLDSAWNSRVGGPIFSVDITGKSVKVIDGKVIFPLSLFFSVVSFPAAAFRTDVIRRAVKHILPDCPLYNENIIHAEVSAEGNVVIDPFIGGFFYLNEASYSGVAAKDTQRWPREWKRMVNAQCERLAAMDGAWRIKLREHLKNDIHQECVEYYLTANGVSRVDTDWDQLHPLAKEIREILLESLPPKSRAFIRQSRLEQGNRKQTKMQGVWTGVKYVAKQILPPVLWRLIRWTKGRTTAKAPSGD